MKIDHELVQKLATLSRLDLTPDEVAHFEQQLPPIVEYVGQLQGLSLADAPPDALPPTTLRADVAAASGEATDILQQAPAKQDGFWKVDSVRS